MHNLLQKNAYSIVAIICTLTLVCAGPLGGGHEDEQWYDSDATVGFTIVFGDQIKI
jgi:hypothetical protein